jgi:nitroreductase
MSVFDAIATRKSTRRFNSRSLDNRSIKSIIEFADKAPSAKDRKPWSFVVITDQSIKVAIAHILYEAARTPTNASSIRDGVEKSADAIVQAPVVLIACDSQTTGVGKDSHPADLLSIGAAIENALLAATGFGLKSLWVGDVLEARVEIANLLSLEHPIISAILLGYR